ncbi:MAG: diadenosine tetraphosphatase, partial [Porticoccaceae bacterium]|nr:diadenosine tetraphosphatase [Porticoccaceae bacterium]
GGERLRVITNYLTRMRFCTDKGNLDLDTKNTLIAPSGLQPWFEYPNRKTMKNNLIFGHWASLEGRYCGERLFPLDTGCVWGGPLRAMNLDTGSYIESM